MMEFVEQSQTPPIYVLSYGQIISAARQIVFCHWGGWN